MLTSQTQDAWDLFLEFIEERCSSTEFENWISPIRLLDSDTNKVILEVPNIFVQQYLIDNYKKDLVQFLPTLSSGEPAIEFVIAEAKKTSAPISVPSTEEPAITEPMREHQELRLNPFYTFDNFIEGPSNQFVKSAALGVAARPGKSYNPLFIHGGVGLGK
ncbi:MAG: chromosomal replication initiator protein DnaA, partial [Chlamydiae bacterium]|nr:chromosomal replication initiator protein DnaA [Chlamydiota bacterium]